MVADLRPTEQCGATVSNDVLASYSGQWQVPSSSPSRRSAAPAVSVLRGASLCAGTVQAPVAHEATSIFPHRVPAFQF